MDNRSTPIDSNLTTDRPTFVSHLECSANPGDEDRSLYPADQIHTVSKTGRPLLVRYNLPALSAAVARDDLKQRPAGLWRYREFLPVRNTSNIVSLGEVQTPLLHLSKLQEEHQGSGSGRLLVKDEGRLPTGSFKARGMCVAVSMAKELGITKIALPTNGNAGGAAAAYAAAAGMKCYVFCPDDNTPSINIGETSIQGSRVYRVKNAMIQDCGKIVRDGVEMKQWFDVSTLREPYRIEGKKTMGLELADQLNWTLPDVILYPTGGGTGLIGMWKAFQELRAVGWIDKERSLPRMVAVQASGCAPIVKAWQNGDVHAEFWDNAHTVAAGIRVPTALGDFLILQAIRESNGFAMAVSDTDILVSRNEVAKTEGLLLCPEGAATYAAYKKAVQEGMISPDETVVLFNCASGLKYELPVNDATLIDFSKPISYDDLE